MNLPPQISRLRTFVDSPRMAKNPIQIFNEYQGELGETYVFHFGGIKKAILSSNPTVLQHVLKTNYENFPKSEIQMKRMCHFLGRGLLTTHGKLWLSQRRLMQQAFHRSHLTQLIAEMQDVIDESLDKLDENYQGKPADIYTEMMKITFRMVMRSLFSTSFSEEDLTTISNSILEVQEFIIKQVMLPFMNPWYFVSGELEKYEKISRKSYDILLKHVQKRRVEKIDRVDFLQILLDCIYEDTGVGMNDEEVLNESMQMMVAGHETSSNALSWTLYLLCLNPEHIEKIRTEVETLFGNNKIAFSELHKLEYTSQVLDESMRLFPPFWMLDREVAETDKVADIDLPKGTMVLANIYGVHHDPKYWDNPEEFRPSRFTKENQKKQQPFTYIPFGGGPRMCIGINYAIAQMQLILVSIIRRYDLELVSGKKTVLKPLIMLKPEEGIKIRFHKR